MRSYSEEQISCNLQTQSQFLPNREHRLSSDKHQQDNTAYSNRKYLLAI